MSSVFLVKENYPEFEVIGAHSTYDLAQKAAEAYRASYRISYCIEEWVMDDNRTPINVWYLEKDKGWRQALKNGEWVYDEV